MGDLVHSSVSVLWSRAIRTDTTSWVGLGGVTDWQLIEAFFLFNRRLVTRYADSHGWCYDLQEVPGPACHSEVRLFPLETSLCASQSLGCLRPRSGGQDLTVIDEKSGLNQSDCH
jgi:hypothetical protein